MTQGSEQNHNFKRTLFACVASLICCFLLIDGAWAGPPPPPPPPDATVPVGGPWGILALIAAIAGYSRWSKRKTKNKSKKRPPEDKT